MTGFTARAVIDKIVEIIIFKLPNQWQALASGRRNCCTCQRRSYVDSQASLLIKNTFFKILLQKKNLFI